MRGLAALSGGVLRIGYRMKKLGYRMERLGYRMERLGYRMERRGSRWTCELHLKTPAKRNIIIPKAAPAAKAFLTPVRFSRETWSV